MANKYLQIVGAFMLLLGFLTVIAEPLVLWPGYPLLFVGVAVFYAGLNVGKGRARG